MTDAIHRPITTMPDAVYKEFADVDLLVAVRFERDELGNLSAKPVVTVLANPNFSTDVTNLAHIAAITKDNGKEYKLLPGNNEVLQFIHPNGATGYCVNRPRWTWVGLSFSQL